MQLVIDLLERRLSSARGQGMENSVKTQKEESDEDGFFSVFFDSKFNHCFSPRAGIAINDLVCLDFYFNTIRYLPDHPLRNFPYGEQAFIH